jgi:predicted nucleic acid-binding protein
MSTDEILALTRGDAHATKATKQVTQAIIGLQERLSGCRGVLVDSNVLLDVATNDPVWGDWSARALADAAEHTMLIIDPIVYAEVSIGYATIEALDAALPAALYHREPLPWEAGFLAGKSFPFVSAARRLANVASARLLRWRACLPDILFRRLPLIIPIQHMHHADLLQRHR